MFLGLYNKGLKTIRSNFPKRGSISPFFCTKRTELMKKHLTNDKWKFLFLFLAFITYAEISVSVIIPYDMLVLDVVFWFCFTWLVVNEQNNKSSD
ncbi:MAG: Unknown protein, partial [uncultured Aureispira sp.]